MRRLRSSAFVLALVLAALANATDQSADGEVYSAVLNHLIGKGMGQEPMVIAISSETMPVIDGYKAAGRPTSLEEDITFRLPRAGKGTIRDFLTKASDSRDVRFSGPTYAKYRFLPERDIVSTVGTNDEAGWKAFAERNADARYIVRFSAIGFNARRSEALVYVQWDCPRLCGGGQYVLLARTNTGWRVRETHLLWIS